MERTKKSPVLTCTNCGAPLLKKDKYCGKCGASIDEQKVKNFYKEAEPAPIYCSNCGTKNGGKAKFCLACGSVLAPEDDVAPAEKTLDVKNPNFQPLWQIFTLNIITFGIYQIWWANRNWTILKEAKNLDVDPAWRSFLGLFFNYSLFSYTKKFSKEAGIKSRYSAILLFILWIIGVFMTRAVPSTDGSYSQGVVIAIGLMIASTAILPVQASMNKLVKATNYRDKPNTNYGLLAFLILIFCLEIFIAFMPASSA